jgi:hypothetical protein
MNASLGLVESAWFFRRGRQYVRIVRVDRRASGLSLVVDGPEGSHTAHHFDDAMACAVHQCELERQLVTKEFHLERVGAGRSKNVFLSRPDYPTGPRAA